MIRDEQTIRFRALLTPVAELLTAVSEWGGARVRPYVLRHLGVQS